MEYYKKVGKRSWAKHLRKKKGRRTKPMANKTSRRKVKEDIQKEVKEQ